MRDLYVSRIDPHISCSRIGRPIVGIYKSLTCKHMNLEIGSVLFWNICFEFSVLCLCTVKRVREGEESDRRGRGVEERVHIISRIHKEFHPLTYGGKKSMKAITFQKNPQVDGGLSRKMGG